MNEKTAATARRATRTDVATLAALFAAEYPDSSHPFQCAVDIEHFVDDPCNIGVVLEIDGAVVASAAMTRSAWNDSYELGRVITHRAFRRGGLAVQAVRQAVEAACERGAGSLFFGFPRVQCTADLIAALDPPFVVVGHDAGRDHVAGRRKVHLIACCVPRHARFRHVAPAVSAVLESAWLRDRLYPALRLEMMTGEYPLHVFVGARTEGDRANEGFVLTCDESRDVPTLEIVGDLEPASSEDAVCRRLDRLLKRHGAASHHATVTVLADKVALVRRLAGMGFEITAYLPAWYAWHGCRFDCVQLVRAQLPTAPVIDSFEATLAGLRTDLPRLHEMPATRSPSRKVEPEPVWKPQIFRGARAHEQRACVALMRGTPGLRIHDTLVDQLRELLRSRAPADTPDADELDARVLRHVGAASLDEYGCWVHYPWSGQLVHLLDADEFAELRTDRNRYKLTPREQTALGSMRVGVVGLSTGHEVAMALALERSFGAIRLADFDTLELSNLNRVRSGVHNLGLPKAVLTAREISEIDPFVDVEVFADGLDATNLERFFEEGGRLDAVVDECDGIDVKILLREHARRLRVPVVMATSDRGMLDIERFDIEPARAVFHGLAGDADPASLSALTNEQKLPHVLRILGVDALTARARASMMEIGQSVSTWPQLGADVTQGGGMAAEAVRRILLGQHAPSGRHFADLGRVFAAATPESLVAVQTTPRAVARAPVASTSGLCALTSPPGALTLERLLLRSLVERACLAPSGGNSQPWRWIANGAGLHLMLDPERSSGLVDHALAGSFAALGAAAESLRLAAHSEGLEIRIDPLPQREVPHHVASAWFFHGQGGAAVEAHWRDELAGELPRRCTDRQLGNGGPLQNGTLETLTDAVRSVAGADVRWLTERADIDRVAGLVAAADRLRLLHPVLHAEMFSELRWTRDDAHATRDGIEVEGLHLSIQDRAGLQLCRDHAPLELLQHWHLGHKLGRLSRKAMLSSSAVGLIHVVSLAPAHCFAGGRALQRLWLAASALGLAMHPMTVLPYLIARVLHSGGQGIDAETATHVRTLLPAYRQCFDLDDRAGELLLFRLSITHSAPARSLRRNVDDVLRWE